ncbi:hypothetical protein GCM10023226_39100 [Nocardioides nanhaiensis]|uniref:Uncharacterized protein n=1 Tax=Nocardioides nanhaiensis TaxID=1476871 RepID=A0ABP8X0A9_9ACTN
MPAAASCPTTQTATVSSAEASTRDPATTEAATIATPSHRRGSRQPGRAARVAGGGAARAPGGEPAGEPGGGEVAVLGALREAPGIPRSLDTPP